MHVGLLTTSFPLPGNPASGIFVARLAQHLSRDIAVTVLTPAGVELPVPSADNAYRLCCFRYAPRRWQRIAHQPGGIPVALKRQRWLWLLLPGFLIGMFLACLRLARGVNLLHANWAAVGAVAGIAGRLVSTPVITTFRGSDVERLQSSRLDRMLLALCVRTNERLVCVSEAMREQVAALMPDAHDKLSVIPNGVDDHFLQIRRRANHQHTFSLALLMVGSFIPRKAVQFALEALQHLADQSRAELTLVGDGPERRALEKRIELYRLRNRVHMRGQLPPHRIPELLEQADVLVLTSLFEGRPNVVLEAMAAGLPVIASRISGVTELVQHEITGLLFEPGNVPALAECIMRLDRDPELRARMGESGRQFIREHGLLWTHTIEAYLGVYRAACGSTIG